MLRLRPYKACDAEKIVSWITDEEMFYKWSADRYQGYPITKEDINNFYNENAYKDDFYEMTAFNETGIVGHFIMRFIDQEKKILRFGFVIVDNTKQGKGYGKEMLTLAIQYAFHILKVDKITIGVFDNNKPAYYCYKSVGFKEMEPRQVETYTILGEEWKCIELELGRD